MDRRIRVVIADDHPMFREGVGKTLSDFANCEVVAECGDADDVLEAVCEHLPDIALLDISMPGGGIEAARRIAAACPVVRILMLTVSESESDVMDAKRARMLKQVSEDGPSCLGVFRKAYASASLRAAVDAHCLECCWLDRQAIRECTATACGLWNVRPYQKKRKGEAASK